MPNTTPTLYGIPNCDTMKKTRKWLESNSVEYQFHDYKKLGIDEALAKRFIQAIPLDTLINKRGTTWRKLSPDVQNSLDSTSAIKIITENPSIVRRPLIEKDSQWLAGYDETQLRSLLAQ
ncbi:MAG: ArsC family reductase [Gammaproteobacteria bacterium]